jgi:hypothetical protein
MAHWPGTLVCSVEQAQTATAAGDAAADAVVPDKVSAAEAVVAGV